MKWWMYMIGIMGLLTILGAIVGPQPQRTPTDRERIEAAAATIQYTCEKNNNCR